jgi:hypothetical protein
MCVGRSMSGEPGATCSSMRSWKVQSGMCWLLLSIGWLRMCLLGQLSVTTYMYCTAAVVGVVTAVVTARDQRLPHVVCQ